MEAIVATTPEELARIPVYDAWFDADESVHDPTRRSLTLRFAEEPAADTDSDARLVRRRRWTREYRVPFRDWIVVVRHVRAISFEDGWADMGMLEGLDFDPARGELLIHSNDSLRVAVDQLDVRATDQGVRWMRRRVNLLGFASHSPW